MRASFVSSRPRSRGSAAVPIRSKVVNKEFPPFLLTMPTYGGTLAAARCLGEVGVPVTMAGDAFLAPARWSRYVTHWETCPSVLDADRFFDWLVEFGRREPGHVLYPTCDDLAWLFADRAAELLKSFVLYEP